MTSCDFHMGSVATLLQVASFHGDSFARQSEATEHVSKYCLISEGVWSGSEPHFVVVLVR
jgi:hypothetical protein